MLAIRLDEKTENRLEELAGKTGRTKTWYARKEDAAIAASAYEEYLLDGGISSPLEDVRRRLGLEN